MTNTGTMTLTDFLLARIAEDKATAEGSDVGGDSAAFRTPYGWGGEVFALSVSRALAECEAKRRIVEQAGSDYISTIGYAHSGTIDSAPILRLLALPYADHPDYREEWKP